MARRMLTLVALVLAAAVVGACGGDGDGAATTSPPPTTTGETGSTTTDGDTGDGEDGSGGETTGCTNEQYGFTVRYPADWHTNAGDVVPACSFFHPEPFEVPEATEATGFAIMARREPVAIERITGNGLGTNVLEREEVEVAGRPAVRRETEATGEGLFPAGLRATQYLVDLDGETLVLETYAVEELDYERNVEVLDDLAETLELENG